MLNAELGMLNWTTDHRPQTTEDAAVFPSSVVRRLSSASPQLKQKLYIYRKPPCMKRLLLFAICQLLNANCFSQGFNWDWAREGSGGLINYVQYGNAVASNPVAGVYLTGSFNVGISFGNDTISGYPANYVYYLARFDTA